MRSNQREVGSGSSVLIGADRAGNVVGIDPHKHTLTAIVVDGHGGIVAGEHFRVSGDGYRALEAWALSFGAVARWGVENAAGWGRHTAIYRTALRSRAWTPPSAMRPSQLALLVAAADTTLGELCGLSTRSVGELLVEIGDPHRFTEGGFARFNGSAPLAASTAEGPGEPVRHRFNPGSRPPRRASSSWWRRC